jgi:hypothetical protein
MTIDFRAIREQIPSENGENETKIKRFINIVDNIFENLPVNTSEIDKRRLINIIKSKLEGTAYEVAELSDQTWEDIRLALKKTFATPLDLQS